MKRFIALTVLILMLTALLCGCGGGDSKTDQKALVTKEYLTELKGDAGDPIALIELSSGGKIEIELYPLSAPNTVCNFISLANKGFYDGLTFHRVIRNQIVQGGDPDGNGTGGPGYSIKGEFSDNGIANDVTHARGTISMARTSKYDTAGSQFFITLSASASYDGKYAAFGTVISGMDYVDALGLCDTDIYDRPIETQTIKKITVNTFGVNYPEPDVIK